MKSNENRDGVDHLLTFFGVERAPGDLPFEFAHEACPTGLAPFIRRAEGGWRAIEAGHFDLVLAFAKELVYGRRTYNARSEKVHQLASFRDAWKRGQRCIVPAECIYEPCYVSGKAVR